MQHELDGVSPSDENAFKEWQKKVDNEINELDKAIKQQAPVETGGTPVTARVYIRNQI